MALFSVIEGQDVRELSGQTQGFLKARSYLRRLGIDIHDVAITEAIEQRYIRPMNMEEINATFIETLRNLLQTSPLTKKGAQVVMRNAPVRLFTKNDRGRAVASIITEKTFFAIDMYEGGDTLPRTLAFEQTPVGYKEVKPEDWEMIALALQGIPTVPRKNGDVLMATELAGGSEEIYDGCAK